jgi:8-oxo-dGTP pyrophosphatase MutT (NUDIX family)
MAFWASWPALWVYLHGSHRTRIIVHCNGKVVLVKSWLGTNNWGLPGGGLHDNEDPKAGALRELQEETGILAKPEQLKPLQTNAAGKEHGLPFLYDSFILELKDEILLQHQKYELVDVKWLEYKGMNAAKELSTVTRQVLAAWSNT